MSLYSRGGERLYINRSERQRFLQQAMKQRAQTRLLALLLFYTGCRISEALSIKAKDVQLNEGIVSIRTLKKRNRPHVREIAIPHDIAKWILSNHAAPDSELVSMSRSTAWRHIAALMERAEISGKHATPKGLRHSFGMWCAFNAIPITLCQRWMGHATVQTTAIYYQIVGKEERELAARLWH